MEQLGNILAEQQVVFKRPGRKINIKWEKAQEFAHYVGLKVTFILKCFKLYGMDKVLAERSFIKDAPTTKKYLPGLLIWRLKGGGTK